MSDLSFWIAGPAIAARSALGAMFLHAGVSKLRDPRGFADIVAAYGVVPEAASVPAAGALLVLELATAGMLLAAIGLPVRLSFVAGGMALLLLGLFVGAMIVALQRGRAGIACGCRAGPTALGWRGVGLTALLLPLAVLAAVPMPAPAAWVSAQAVLAGLLLLALHDAGAQLRSHAHEVHVRRTRR